MPGVELFVQELVGMHKSVEEVLPSINDKPGLLRHKTKHTAEGMGDTYIATKSWSAGTAHQYTNSVTLTSMTGLIVSPRTGERNGLMTTASFPRSSVWITRCTDSSSSQMMPRAV